MLHEVRQRHHESGGPVGIHSPASPYLLMGSMSMSCSKEFIRGVRQCGRRVSGDLGRECCCLVPPVPGRLFLPKLLPQSVAPRSSTSPVPHSPPNGEERASGWCGCCSTWRDSMLQAPSSLTRWTPCAMPEGEREGGRRMLLCYHTHTHGSLNPSV